jgi:MOSC domain-containing protein YiiM
MKAEIIATSISEKKGTSKTNVDSITLVEDLGVKDDAHAGPGLRQVSFIGMDTIRKIIEKGINIEPGGFGENITTEGVVLYELPVGTKFVIGDVEMEVTQIGKECHEACAIRKKVGDCPMPREGIFARVIKGGDVSAGSTIEIS